IGKVPVDRISSDGYADTTVDPGYHFQVKDSPFGGTLPVKINHERAFNEGASYYKLKVDGNEPRQMWNEYKWSTSNDRFNLETRKPVSGGYYRVKEPDELWYDHWLGYRLGTGGFTNGKHTVEVEFYGATNSSSLINSETVDVRIDNQRPRAEINDIIHQHDTDGSTPVGTCGIVEDGGDDFTFMITAEDPEGHLRSWRLTTVWGDNKSAHVTSDTYEPPRSGVTWNGIVNQEVPPASSPWSATVSGDPTSRRCARTFYLRVWDRTINGEHYIHRSDYHKSITLMLPPA
ncbi:MAG: hypothetical protein SXQ77_04150, partial [Halobacteria archaeon]|nr:hypothetical protein [Halobacteria archaeon]